MTVMALNGLIGSIAQPYEWAQASIPRIKRCRLAIQTQGFIDTDVLACTPDVDLWRLLENQATPSVLKEIWEEYERECEPIMPKVRNLPILLPTPMGVLAHFKHGNPYDHLPQKDYMICQSQTVDVLCKDSFLLACYQHNEVVKYNALARLLSQLVHKYHIDELELAVLYGADWEYHMECLNYFRPTRRALLEFMEGEKILNPHRCIAFDKRHLRFLRTHEPYENGLPVPKVGRIMDYNDFKGNLIEMFRDDNICIVYTDPYRHLDGKDIECYDYY